MDFDPFVFNMVENADRTVELFSDFYFENRANKKLMPTAVVREGDAVVVTVTNRLQDPDLLWEYRFDLSQGGLPVFVQGGLRSGDDVIGTWKSRYVQIRRNLAPS